MFIRLKILESPAFIQAATERAQGGAAAGRQPSATTAANLLLAMGMRVAENGLFYIYTVFVLSYGPTALGVSRATMLWASRSRRWQGWWRFRSSARLSDRVGRRPVYLFGAVFSLALRAAVLLAAAHAIAADHLAGDVLGVALGHNAMYGPQAAYFSELFGARVRYSGASLSYQLASVAAGGLAPFIATALLAKWGTPAVAGYMMLLASVTVAAAYAAPETHAGGLAE